jgi:hypothetical protein
VARDETAWTWWTLPAAIAGCMAQRYHVTDIGPFLSCWTSRNARTRSGVITSRRTLLATSGYPECEDEPLPELIDGVAARAVHMRPRIRPMSIAECDRLVLASRACNRLCSLDERASLCCSCRT